MDIGLEIIAKHYAENTDGKWVFTDQQLTSFVKEIRTDDDCFNLQRMASIITAVTNSDSDKQILYFRSAIECETLEKTFTSRWTVIRGRTPNVLVASAGMTNQQLSDTLTLFLEAGVDMLLISSTFLDSGWQIAPFDSRVVLENLFTWCATDEEQAKAQHHLRQFANGLPNVIVY